MSRKVKELDSLLRLQGWAVDERRRELGVLLARQGVLIEQDQEMDRQLTLEKEIARSDPAFAGHNFSVYIANHFRKKEAMAMLLAGIATEVEAARDRLAGAYREQKVLDEVQKKRLEEQRIDEGRREQAYYDEVSQTQFARRHL